ncbi:MAG TPA: glycosyltransferase family 1 protein [Dehalococcoidia bacterium]|nr:glycosyltransferase family 1 protein [Dehalococcoidia bacterium]
MRIAIDATSVPPRPAGAGVYAIQLVTAMAARDRRDGYALFARGRWADGVAAGKPNWRVERVGASSRPARLAWEQARLPGVLHRLGIDVLHSTHHTLPVRGVRCKRVVTVHDLTFLRMPQRYPAARRLYMQVLTRLAAHVADKIIVPSLAVRGDVTRLLGVPAARIAVVYEAAGAGYAPLDRASAEAVARRYGIVSPYVLSVGSLEPGKNRARLFRALRRLVDDGIDLRLAVVGQRAWSYESDLALLDELRLRDRVVVAGYVPQDDLPALYNAATAFAFPSLYEGFGLPLIEAMACGVPALTSNVSATAEVAGDAAVLVDPRSTDEIYGGLRRLLTDAALRVELSRRGRERAAGFSWRRAADETHSVYARALSGALEPV